MSVHAPSARAWNVTLVNPPSAPGTLANREGAGGLGTLHDLPGTFFYPPHTLATVAAVLRDAGHAVRAVDALVQEYAPRDLADADAVGVFISYASLDSDLAFLAAMRAQTAARLIAFGPAMRFVGEQVLAGAAVDAVLSGEAEGFFATLLRVASSDESIWRTPRLWTPADVQAVGCDADGFVQNLDALPLPAWEFLPVEKYPLLTVLSSRGCPDLCAYCPYTAAQGHRFRSRSAESVLDELTWLCQRFHPARVVFRDPVFAYDRGRAVAICEGILRRGLELSWSSSLGRSTWMPTCCALCRALAASGSRSDWRRQIPICCSACVGSARPRRLRATSNA